MPEGETTPRKRLTGGQGDDEDLLKVDVMEVYSPPRVVKEASNAGLNTKPNTSLDLTTRDNDGAPWGLFEDGNETAGHR